jgi:hypothetical protein
MNADKFGPVTGTVSPAVAASSALYALAAEMMRLHGTEERAAGPLMNAVQRDPKLQRAMALHYLYTFREEDTGYDVTKAAVGSDFAAAINAEMTKTDSSRGGHVPPVTPTRSATPARTDEKTFAVTFKPKDPPKGALEAAKKAHEAAARSVLDTFTIRDGRAIGDVRYGELERLVVTNAVEAAVLNQIRMHVVADASAYVRDLIGAKRLAEMIEAAKTEVADA